MFGLAVSVQNKLPDGGCVNVLTLVVHEFVVPLKPVTTSVKVRDPLMLLKVREPLVDTNPASVSVADAAFVEFQVTVVEPLNGTSVGLAEMVQLGACWVCVCTVVWHVFVPPGPETTKVKVRVPVMFENV